MRGGNSSARAAPNLHHLCCGNRRPRQWWMRGCGCWSAKRSRHAAGACLHACKCTRALGRASSPRHHPSRHHHCSASDGSAPSSAQPLFVTDDPRLLGCWWVWRDFARNRVNAAGVGTDRPCGPSQTPAPTAHPWRSQDPPVCKQRHGSYTDARSPSKCRNRNHQCRLLCREPPPSAFRQQALLKADKGPAAPTPTTGLGGRLAAAGRGHRAHSAAAEQERRCVASAGGTQACTMRFQRLPHHFASPPPSQA